MTHAAITGWGKCLPPAVLTNQDLATFLDTDDEWIESRTGMKERRISHVPLGDLAHVAAARALACAGLAAESLDLVIVGTTLADEIAPNAASGVQARLGAANAAAMDLNTACTSFLYGLSTATALIRTGVVRTALVVGAEVPSPFVDWDDRNTAVLFGDGCGAAVVQATDREEGLLSEQRGCYADARAEVVRCRGSQFDPKVVDAFLEISEEEWDRIRLDVETVAVLSADLAERPPGLPAGAHPLAQA